MLNLEFESGIGSKGDGLCEHIHICSVLNELHIYKMMMIPRNELWPWFCSSAIETSWL